MLEVVTITELVMEAAIETVIASDIESSVVEAQGSDILLMAGDVVPEVIEVA